MRLALALVALHLGAPALAAPVQLVHQARVLDAAGAPVNGQVDLVVALCPNPSPTGGEACHAEAFPGTVAADGYVSVVLGLDGSLQHGFFDAPALWVALSADGGATELSPRQPLLGPPPRPGMLYLGGPGTCGPAGQGEGAVAYQSGALMFCDGAAWRTVSTAPVIVEDGGARRWSDGSYAASCEGYIRPDSGGIYAGATGSAVYRIDPDATGPIAPFDVWCDMVTADGGWTLLLNLDTSDGHVMWWGAGEWTSTATYGTVDATPFSGDLKTGAYANLSGAAEVLLVVHQQGSPVGWKRFQKANGSTLYAAMTSGGENHTWASSVLSSSTGSIWSGERLVRLSTTLVTNRCVTTGGNCLTNNGGSPDGDRISSLEATGPADNFGGGLGNWHDQNYCCSGSIGGHSCNGSTIRTASEAQAGWSYTSQWGTFGTDSYLPMSGTERDSSCGNANWARSNGYAYDYALYLR